MKPLAGEVDHGPLLNLIALDVFRDWLGPALALSLLAVNIVEDGSERTQGFIGRYLFLEKDLAILARVIEPGNATRILVETQLVGRSADVVRVLLEHDVKPHDLPELVEVSRALDVIECLEWFVRAVVDEIDLLTFGAIEIDDGVVPFSRHHEKTRHHERILGIVEHGQFA